MLHEVTSNVSKSVHTSVIESDGSDKIFGVTINSEAILSGLIKEVGHKEMLIFLGIMAHADEYGQAFPSQRRLATILGMSPTTVNAGIKKLLNVKINGEYLIKREFVTSDKIGKYSMYAINDDSLTGTINVERAVAEETQERTPDDVLNSIRDKAKANTLAPYDVLLFFKITYEKTFGIPYVENKKFELGLIKNKIMKNITDNVLLLDTVEFAVVNYSRLWGNTSYPYPKIGALGNWILNDALQKMKREQQYEAEKEAEANIEYDNSFFLSL